MGRGGHRVHEWTAGWKKKACEILNSVCFVALVCVGRGFKSEQDVEEACQDYLHRRRCVNLQNHTGFHLELEAKRWVAAERDVWKQKIVNTTALFRGQLGLAPSIFWQLIMSDCGSGISSNRYFLSSHRGNRTEKKNALWNPSGIWMSQQA